MAESEGEPTVAEAMTRNVITVDGDSTVQEAAELLKRYKIHGLVVADKDTKRVGGVITDKDIVSKVVAENKIPSEIKVCDIMASNLIVADEDDSVSQAAKMMHERGISRAPVVDRGGRLKGIITTRDIVRVLPDFVNTLYSKGIPRTQDMVYPGEAKSPPQVILRRKLRFQLP